MMNRSCSSCAFWQPTVSGWGLCWFLTPHPTREPVGVYKVRVGGSGVAITTSGGFSCAAHSPEWAHPAQDRMSGS
jgi:hypothetical protein